MAILQVKGLDDRLYKALAARAMRENRSISQEVVTMLQDSLGTPSTNNRRATEEFLALAGSWADDRSEKTIADELRKKRRSGRRFGNADVFA